MTATIFIGQFHMLRDWRDIILKTIEEHWGSELFVRSIKATNDLHPVQQFKPIIFEILFVDTDLSSKHLLTFAFKVVLYIEFQCTEIIKLLWEIEQFILCDTSINSIITFCGFYFQATHDVIESDLVFYTGRYFVLLLIFNTNYYLIFLKILIFKHFPLSHFE